MITFNILDLFSFRHLEMSQCNVFVTVLCSITVMNCYCRVAFTVDGKTKSAVVPRISTSFERLIVGGTSASVYNNIPVRENFRGCMNDLTLNGR